MRQLLVSQSLLSQCTLVPAHTNTDTLCGSPLKISFTCPSAGLPTIRLTMPSSRFGVQRLRASLLISVRYFIVFNIIWLINVTITKTGLWMRIRKCILFVFRSFNFKHSATNALVFPVIDIINDAKVAGSFQIVNEYCLDEFGTRVSLLLIATQLKYLLK